MTSQLARIRVVPQGRLRGPWAVFHGDELTRAFASVGSGVLGGPGGCAILLLAQPPLISPVALDLPWDHWPCRLPCPCDGKSTDPQQAMFQAQALPPCRWL